MKRADAIHRSFLPARSVRGPFGLPARVCLLGRRSGAGAWRRCIVAAIVWGLLAASLSCAGAQAPGEAAECYLTDGSSFPARFAGVDAEGGFLFQTDSGHRSVPRGQLVRWGRVLELHIGPAVVLGDGALLAARSVALEGDVLLVDCESLGRVAVPSACVAGVVFQVPGETLAKDLLFDRLARPEGDADVLLLTNGDEIAGRIETIEPFSVGFSSPVGPLHVETARLRGLVFNPALQNTAALPPQYVVLGTRDGSRVPAHSITPHARGVSVVFGGALRAVVPVWQITAIQAFGDPVTYLSDLEPAGYRNEPFLQVTWPYRRDRNVLGGHLRCGGRLYLKGIGVHSRSRISFALGGRYRIFQAELGIDDAAEGGGSVQFRVFVDGQEKYASPVIRGGRPPVPVLVDVAGGKQLDLEVDFADLADVLDRADWLDARLLR